MASKIIFLGTAGDTYVFSKNVRNPTGIVIKSDNSQIILDPASGSVMNLARNGINVRETTAILGTTSETIFTGDINSLVSAMSFDGMDPHGILIGNKQMFNGKNNSEKENNINNKDATYDDKKNTLIEFPTILEKTKKSVEKSINMTDSKRISINNIEISSMNGLSRTKDNKELIENSDNLIYKINIDNTIIGYVTNTAFSEEIANFLNDCTIIILSLIDFDEYSRINSMNVNDVIELIRKVEPALAMITNFGIKVMKNDPLMIAREIHQKTNTQIISASDSLSITPTNFSKKPKQKNLNSYN